MRSQIDAAEGQSSSDVSLLNSVLVYDTEKARSQALSTLELVAGNAGEEGSLTPELWRVKELADRGALEEAAAHAAEADMVIVSLENAEKVPAELQDWIDLWSPRRTPGDGALVGMVPKSESVFEASPVLELLEETALSVQMDFIYGSRSRWDIES